VTQKKKVIIRKKAAAPEPPPAAPETAQSNEFDFSGDIPPPSDTITLDTGSTSNEPDLSRVDNELLANMLLGRQQIMAVHQSGLHPELLASKAVQQAFKALLVFYQQREFPMPKHIFRERFPEIDLPDTPRPDTHAVLFDLEVSAKRRLIREAGISVEQLINPETGGSVVDPEKLGKVFEVWRHALKRFNEQFSKATDRVQSFGDGSDILEAYEQRAAGKFTGIPIFFGCMREDLTCWELGHLTGFVARPGERKTFLLLFLIAATTVAHKIRSFIHSSEMQAIELKFRIVAMLAGVHYGNFVKGQLSMEDRKKVDSFQKSDMLKLLNELLFIAGPTAVKDVSDAEILINEHQTALVGLDNIHTYAAEGAEKHIRIDNIMFDLKYMAIRQNCHVMFTTHQNRTGSSGMAGVAYGDGINTWASNLANIVMTRGDIMNIQTFKVRSGKGNMIYKVEMDLGRGIVRELGRREARQRQTAGPEGDI